jgi:hypothetical protein
MEEMELYDQYMKESMLSQARKVYEQEEVEY